ncbi:ABC transporter substrate-binding protein [Rhodococcus pyridinivorans KG-16]|uniref:ABC transporter substrate-binding protein n=1 Tax=Rhodococcus pyridinivorans KG-16 TaxID=1441730 RepID=A0A0V9ULL6_9NOCA|nr:glycine betaine ABC transporter substrate-binding protein [Rhodococcus pyridinivorans]KSZ58893.1 ABC transporter substrate-binding protein [Rhodococcus pyridinivorans KG-16]
MTAVANEARRIRPVAATGRRTACAVVLTVCAAAAVLQGCASPVLDEATPSTTVIVGAGERPDEELLAHLYAGALRGSGIDVQVRSGVADPTAALDADLTLIPGYTGRLLASYDPGADATDAEDVFEALARALPDELTISDYASAQDRAVLLADRERLTQWSVSRVADLADRCADLTFAVTEDFDTAGGLTALERADCRPREVRRIEDAQSVAVASESDTVVGTTTTSSALAEIDADSPVSTVPDAPDRSPQDDTNADDAPAPVLPAQNVVPVFRKGTLDEAQLDALRTIAGELTTSDLTELRARVEEGDDPETVAREWIDEHAGA